MPRVPYPQAASSLKRVRYLRLLYEFADKRGQLALPDPCRSTGTSRELPNHSTSFSAGNEPFREKYFHMLKRGFVLILTTGVALGIGQSGARPSAPDAQHTVEVFTGNFITLDSLTPRAQAIAVGDGRIVAVGTRRHVDSVAGRGARHTRVAGFALPGFVDAHVHAAALGEQLEILDLRGASKAQVLARVRAAAARASPGIWIRGAGWDQSFWRPPAFPTAAELDGVSAGRPVILERIDGHAVWVNSRAMELAELTRVATDPSA